MANELSSAGVLLKYALESTSGTRPTTGYTVISGIKEIPDMNEAPEQLDVTDLAETQYKRYIPGLKDTGGALAFKANLTIAFRTAWEALMTAYEGGIASSKSMWFEVYVPNFGSFYFAGVPVSLGMSGMSVDSVLEIDAYITPNKIEGWSTSST